MIDVTFEPSSDGKYLKRWYSGGYLIVDNGYLDWPVLIPPLKSYINHKELRWSKWVESLRKDVECLFGIQNSAFKVLQSGVMVHGVSVTDKIWLTCSALHNFLNDENGDIVIMLETIIWLSHALLISTVFI